MFCLRQSTIPDLYFLIISRPYQLYHLCTLSCSYLAAPLRKNLSLHAESRGMADTGDSWGWSPVGREQPLQRLPHRHPAEVGPRRAAEVSSAPEPRAPHLGVDI